MGIARQTTPFDRGSEAPVLSRDHRERLLPVLALILPLAVCIGRAEIIDRIAANIGQQAITDQQVIEQARLTAVIEGTPVDLSAENKRQVLDRMIDQALVRKEVDFTKFPSATAQEAEPLLKQVRDRYPTEDAFVRALNAGGISEDALRQYLVWQVTFLRFVEYRFQPSVQITDTEVRQEYGRQTSGWTEKHKTPPPSLDQMRSELQKIVRQKLTDSALDRWLGEVRTQFDIIYHEGYKL